MSQLRFEKCLQGRICFGFKPSLVPRVILAWMPLEIYLVKRLSSFVDCRWFSRHKECTLWYHESLIIECYGPLF